MRIVLLGAGHIGQTIARLFAESGDYHVTVVDRSAEALAHLGDVAAHARVRTLQADTSSAPALLAALQGHDAVVNALPYHLATLAATSSVRSK